MKFLTSIVLFFLTFSLSAQITSSELKGKILDASGVSIPGALVEVLHLPTGSVVKTRSDAEGEFYLANLKSGGPYHVTFSYTSYQSVKEEDVFLVLGETRIMNAELNPSIQELDQVIVRVDINEIRKKEKKGTETSLGKDQIGKLPTLNRSLQDLTRLSPQASGNSYAGSNYRYNNLSIDGVAHNDAFGFQEPNVGAGGSTAAGSPGALSKTQPLSLDAVGEIQISTSPYDVKLGNFTGGSLNVVTRSGTNTLEASIYSFTKNNRFTGRSPYESREKIASFYDLQSGFRIGGAMKKNKLFYFVNVENGTRSEPLLFRPGTEGSIFSLSDISQFYDTVKSRYGYDLGSFGDRNLQTQSNKVFLRVDYNINDNHQLVVRHNLVQAKHDNLSRLGNIFNFESQGFEHNSNTNSTVLELKSRLGVRLYNNLILGHSRIHDSRDPFGGLFPHIEIKYKTSGDIFAGSYREAAMFQMKQATYELTNNLNYYKDKHKLTVGIHNELYDFDYHFITPYTGRWQYDSLAAFYNNRPSRIRGTYSLTNNDFEYNYNRPTADFGVMLSSLYAQDDFSVSKRLRLTYGVRLEGNIFLKDQGYDESVKSSSLTAPYSQRIKNTFLLAPRVGFNYILTKNERAILRGGVGIFAGRMPFSWSAYSYIYNGAQFGSVDVRPKTEVDLITSDFSQMAALAPGKREVNVIDPNFKLPRVLRNSLALDLNLKNNWAFTLEGIFTQNLYDAFFQTINLKDSTVQMQGAGNDTRDVYLGSGDAQRVDGQFANVFLLTNTRKGYRYSISASLSKKFSNKINAMTAYTYGVAKDVMNGVRVSPQANWEWNQTVGPNSPELSYSNFDLRHRIIVSTDYTLDLKAKWKTVISIFGIASSGSPFTYVYNGDINRDASSTNDLIYVPQSASEINLVDVKDVNGAVLVSAEQQWKDLEAYIASDNYLSSRKGQYAERNGARTPWNVQLDLHLGQDFTMKGKRRKHTFTATADIFNFTNLLNYRWGRQYFVPNTTNAGFALISAKTSADGVTEYKFIPPSSKPWQIDGIASRLQMQMGLRYSF